MRTHFVVAAADVALVALGRWLRSAVESLLLNSTGRLSPGAVAWGVEVETCH